ncbi:hypothetical protein ACVJDU_005852 [Bradyrhizobium diazoefficiens]
MHDRAAGRPVGIAGTTRPLRRRSRELADSLCGVDLKAARAIERAVDHHAGFAGRGPETRAVTGDEPGAELEVCAHPLHIGLDRQAACADEIRKIIDTGARGLHRALVCAAFDLDAVADEQGIDTVQPQPADMQTVRAALDQARDARSRIASRLDQACDDHAVGTAQAVDRDLRARMELALLAAGDDLLTEHRQLVALHLFDRTRDLARDRDAARDQRAVSPTGRDHARKLADAQRIGAGRLAVDSDRNVARIGDALAIDVDTAEALDHADDAGAADAVIIASRDPGAADALIGAAPDLRVGNGRAGEPESRQQQTAGDERRPAHEEPPSLPLSLALSLAFSLASPSSSASSQ